METIDGIILLVDHTSSIGTLPNACDARPGVLNFLKKESVSPIFLSLFARLLSTTCSFTSAAKIILLLVSRILETNEVISEIKCFLGYPSKLYYLRYLSLYKNVVPTTVLK